MQLDALNASLAEVGRLGLSSRMDSAPIMLTDAELAALLDLDTAIATQRQAFHARGGRAHCAPHRRREPVAADALAGPDAAELAVLSSGRQARAHVPALHRVPLRRVRIWSPDAGRRAAAAPLVATCTLSETPVPAAEQLAAGATVLSVGSFEPHRCEVEAAVVRAARVVVDDVATALRHAGPVMQGVAEGTLRQKELASLGDVLVGRAPGHSDPEQLVFYNSVGLGVQDAAAAHQVLAAHASGLKTANAQQ